MTARERGGARGALVLVASLLVCLAARPSTGAARRVTTTRYAEITVPTATEAPASVASIDPQRTGRSRSHLPRQAPSVLWSAAVNATYGTSAIVAQDGSLYVGTGDGLVALDPTGRQRWSTSLGASAATPALTTDGDIAVASLDGRLFLVGPDGVVRVRAVLQGAPLAPPPRRMPTRTPARLRAPYMGVLFAAPLPLADGSVLGGIPATGLHVLSADGTLRPFLGGAETSYAVPAMLPDGTLLLTSRRGGAVMAMRPDPDDPAPERWRSSVEETFGATLIGLPDGGGAVLLGDGQLVRLRAGGAVAWRTSFGTSALGVALAADGSFRVLLALANLASVGPDGAERWRMHFGATSWVPPLLDADGATLVADADTPTLVALEPDGSERWRVHLGQVVGGRPVLAADGTIYLPDNGGVILALR